MRRFLRQYPRLDRQDVMFRAVELAHAAERTFKPELGFSFATHVSYRLRELHRLHEQQKPADRVKIYRTEEKIDFLIALLLAASPVAAQTSQVQRPLGTGVVTNNSPLTDTGVICQQEMVATFCNDGQQPEQRGLWIKWRCCCNQRRNHHAFSRHPGLWRRHRQRQRAAQLMSVPPVVALLVDLRWLSYTPPGETPLWIVA